MPLIHPDKLVGVTRAIQSRPTRPRPSIRAAAQRAAANPRPLVRKGKQPKREPGILENMAFQLRQAHEERHLSRMARRVDAAVGKQKQRVGEGRAAQRPSQGVEPPHVEVRVNGQQAGPLRTPSRGGRRYLNG